MVIPNREDCFALFLVLLLKFASPSKKKKKKVLYTFSNYFAFHSLN